MECAPVVQAVVAAWLGPCAVSIDPVNWIRSTHHEPVFHGDMARAQVDQ